MQYKDTKYENFKIEIGKKMKTIYMNAYCEQWGIKGSQQEQGNNGLNKIWIKSFSLAPSQVASSSIQTVWILTSTLSRVTAFATSIATKFETEKAQMNKKKLSSRLQAYKQLWTSRYIYIYRERERES